MPKDSHFVVLSLGSNIGDRYKHLLYATEKLARIMDVELVSSGYKTSPVNYLEQEFFINICLKGTTNLSPISLLQKTTAITQELEQKNAYQKVVHRGPRIIDIDIIFYDQLILKTKEICIPHPRFVERKFVIVPLIEILNPAINPTNGTRLTVYLSRLSPQEQKTQKIKLDKIWSFKNKKWI